MRVSSVTAGFLLHPLQRSGVGLLAATLMLLSLASANALAAKPPSCSIDQPAADPIVINAGDSVSFTGSVSNGTPSYSVTWDFPGGTPATVSDTIATSGGSSTALVTYNGAGSFTATLNATDSGNKPRSCSDTKTVQVNGGGNTAPTANNDAYNTVQDVQLDVPAPGVLGNDTDPDAGDTITAVPFNGATSAGGTVDLLADGSFSYLPPSGFTGNDSFSYQAQDNHGALSNVATVTVAVDPPPTGLPGAQIDFKIMMNYELGMHCTGFEFAYCCVLPPYNSILAQVVKPDSSSDTGFPQILEGDPNQGLDFLNRQTVLRDLGLDANDEFKKYVLKYWHDAQPRNDGRGKPQSSTLISAVEGNSLLMWNTVYDAAAVDAGNALVTGSYSGATNVVLGDGDYLDPEDSYANGWLNHFYIYSDLEGGNPNNSSAEIDKIRLGLPNVAANFSTVLPENSGPAFHPMGPGSAPGLNNVLTFSGEHGTIVYTQMKVLENLPVTLTSPRIWEALGLPLTPFEDSIDFFGDPGLVDEDSIRPYVAMKAQLHVFDPSAPDGAGAPVLNSAGLPVIGFGTAPIDIPNCERCHSAVDSPNSPNISGTPEWAAVEGEINFWNAFYNIDEGAGDSTWYSRLKGAAVSMLAAHDVQHGTSFTANYPGDPNDPNNPGFGSGLPQNTRLGHESVICQKCHADNVIAVVKSATKPGGELIPPISEAIHWNHRSVSEGGPITFSDSLGRDGGCQGCHPAHRSDGDMAGYPITLDGDNFYAASDNRLANGGCFVGRDVHSNPLKDIDGAETPSHLNAVGEWLVDNVATDQGDWRGIWCTNCHTQLSQELWRTENCPDLVNGDCIVNPRAEPTLAAVAAALGVSEQQAIDWLDPKDPAFDPGRTADLTHAIWDGTISDANVATIEVSAVATGCGARTPVFNDTFGVYVCVDLDVDGDPSVRVLDFCTTDDCVAAAQTLLDGEGNGSIAAPVPFNAATDGRDHWLAPGEPHCADCHAAPYVEQSGNINAFAPFNYPRKASLMRYSRGHQDITCQGCHESIHGLYPVTPTIDTTSYAQAAALNHDGSHGPLKCGSCHEVDADGIPTWIQGVKYQGSRIRTFDEAVSWAHTFTDEATVLDSVCLNCHTDRRNKISETSGKWLRHTLKGRIGRDIQDKAEIEQLGHVAGDPDTIANEQELYDTVCASCHSLQGGPDVGFDQLATCDNTTWKLHLVQGRVAEPVWEFVSQLKNAGSTCGW